MVCHSWLKGEAISARLFNIVAINIVAVNTVVVTVSGLMFAALVCAIAPASNYDTLVVYSSC